MMPKKPEQLQNLNTKAANKRNPKKGTVALSLGSGGARGYTHIGVIDALEAHGYKVVAVSGCSMGAIVGGLYCAGKLEEFRQWAMDLTYFDVLKLVDLSLVSNGVIRGNKVFQQVRTLLNSDKSNEVLIENLKIPFTAVATDLVNSKEVWFQTGSLEKALRASSAIPSIIRPVKYQGTLFVDGGVLNPVPIAPCVSAHADHIIAVDLNTEVPMPDEVLWLSTETKAANQELSEKEQKDWLDSVMDKTSRWVSDKVESSILDRQFTNKDRVKQQTEDQMKESFGMFGTMYKMFDTMQAQISQYKTAGYPPDLLIRVPYDCCETYEFYRAKEMIELGRYIGEQAVNVYESGQSSLYAR